MKSHDQGLVLRDVVIGYSTALLEPISLTVAPGETLAIVGPSGCGKSTLLSTIAGVIPELAGTLFLNGRNLHGVPIQKRSIGVVFQEPLLFSHLSLIDNIAYGLRASRISRTKARARAEELLDWVGLSAVKNNKTWEISGGQAGRVALARALAPNPQAILFDEPYSALDSETRLRIAHEVKDLLFERNIPSIHVTHDRSEAESIATHTLVLA